MALKLFHQSFGVSQRLTLVGFLVYLMSKGNEMIKVRTTLHHLRAIELTQLQEETP